MSTTVPLRISSLFAAEDPGVECLQRRKGLGPRSLAALKILLLAGVVAAALGDRALGPPLRKSVVSSVAGLELRYPSDWQTCCSVPGLVSARERTAAPVGCEIGLVRFSWTAFEEFHGLLAGRALPPGWREQESAVLAAAAACFGMRGPQEYAPAERVALGGRPAAMMVLRCPDGWAAVVVAPAQDLVLAILRAPTAADLRRVWKKWIAMVAATRIRDLRPEPSAGTP